MEWFKLWTAAGQCRAILRQIPVIDGENEVFGSRIRDEASPGNVEIREVPEGVQLIGYDSAGAPHLLETITTAGEVQPAP